MRQNKFQFRTVNSRLGWLPCQPDSQPASLAQGYLGGLAGCQGLFGLAGLLKTLRHPKAGLADSPAGMFVSWLFRLLATLNIMSVGEW